MSKTRVMEYDYSHSLNTVNHSQEGQRQTQCHTSAPGFMWSCRVGVSKVIHDDGDGLLAQERVEVEAALPGHVDHGPILKIDRVADTHLHAKTGRAAKKQQC